MLAALDHRQDLFLSELGGFKVHGLFKEATGAIKWAFGAPQTYVEPHLHSSLAVRFRKVT